MTDLELPLRFFIPFQIFRMIQISYWHLLLKYDKIRQNLNIQFLIKGRIGERICIDCICNIFLTIVKCFAEFLFHYCFCVYNVNQKSVKLRKDPVSCLMGNAFSRTWKRFLDRAKHVLTLQQKSQSTFLKENWK